MLPESTAIENREIFAPAKVAKVKSSASHYSCGAWIITSLLVWPSFFSYPASALPIPETDDTRVVQSVERVGSPTAMPAAGVSETSDAAQLLKPVAPKKAGSPILLNNKEFWQRLAAAASDNPADAGGTYAQQPAAPATPDITAPPTPPVTPNPEPPPDVDQPREPASLSFYDRLFKDKLSINVEQYYYNWNDDLGNNGSQSVTPLTLTYTSGNFDFGARIAYIDSQLNGVITLDGVKVGSRRGQVGTLSDTSVSLAYTFKELSWPIRLTVDLNLPTGKATLTGNEKNAIMDGALVQQTRFGEGFNIAPGISVSHAFGEKDVVGAGVSYIFRGEFDPNGDVVNDEINPGDELVGTLQYQHAERNWLFIGGLIYTNSGVTQRDGKDYYRKGQRLDANATLVVAPFEGHTIQLSGRYYTQGNDDVLNFFSGNLEEESANSNGNALFLGVDWSMALDKERRHTIHLLGDLLKVNANSYDRINDLFVGDRSKVSVGAGYEYAFSPRSRLFIQAKLFSLNDEANPRTLRDISYEGYSIYAILNYNF